ncbi:MAG: universal stress protein [Actinomycetota bacterium]|nr:universal stress protein [Actinomycetota bacterium]
MSEDNHLDFSPGSSESLPVTDSAVGDETATVAPAGRFRIYLGSAAGVGKTCAMLDEGYRRHRRGTDVVIGIVDTHGRDYTATQIRDLEVVPCKVVEYRGSRFEEMDLDAVLERAPEVALVDELAHTNVPGSGKNRKRWQDVTELLDAGISVVTTVNIQHIESLADAVERMTQTKVRERVPDWVVRKADQVELIDSSPEQLRRRMLHGNVYPKEKVSVALNNFFKRENLIALRELALRFMADETEEEMMEFLRRHGAADLWETTERILLGVTGAEGTDLMLHRAARIAARSKADLHVVHISAADAVAPEKSPSVAKIRALAIDLGASWHEIDSSDPAGALVQFAVDHQITQIVLGSSRRSRIEELLKGSVVNKIMRAAASRGVDVHVIARRDHATT